LILFNLFKYFINSASQSSGALLMPEPNNASIIISLLSNIFSFSKSFKF